MTPLAALPMYDLPELQPAHDLLWSALAARLCARGIDAPPMLTRNLAPEAIWESPALLLAQTCGYPLVTSLRGKVRLLATPCYSAPGCEAGFYRSAVVVRARDPAGGIADLRGRRCAMNAASSNSGMNVLRALVAPFAGGTPRFFGRFFGEIVTTGAHVASVTAVASDDADVASIDCVTWAHLQRLKPHLTDTLRVLAWTAATPGLPLITASTTSDVTLLDLQAALADVWRDPGLGGIRDELLIDGMTNHTLEDYDRLLDLECQALLAGYRTLQ